MSASTNRPYRQVARAESSVRLRNAIVDTFLAALRRDWLDDITLDDVASRVGTTRQTVIRMFGGKEGLLEEALQRLHESMDARCVWPPGETIADFARRLVAMRESTGELVMRLIAQEPRHPPLQKALGAARRGHAQELREALEARLSGESAERRALVFAQFRVVTDTFTWAVLRRDVGLSIPETADAIADMLAKALAQPAETSNGDMIS